MIFDSTVVPGDAQALYVSARAELAGAGHRGVLGGGRPAGPPALDARGRESHRQAPPLPRHGHGGGNLVTGDRRVPHNLGRT